MKPNGGISIQTDEVEPRQRMTEAADVKLWSGEWVVLRVWSIHTGGEKSWVTAFKRPGQKRSVAAKHRTTVLCEVVSACTNVAVICYVIVLELAPVWQCSVVWYCERLHRSESEQLCDTVRACTNMAVFSCVIPWVPVPMWQCSVAWYCECLYQYGSVLFFDTVSACTSMAVLCFSVCNNGALLRCVILWVPVTIWQCSVASYCECLYQYGSVLFCDTVSACTNVAELCCVILWVPVPIWQCSVLW